ncbi:hypothetical protein HHK36_003505 [Tetracentron sinense]|uniref:Uncharacterized protein n=1 Tax=Tetracentron sinense TaxID=13715 RepID=A0A834ZRA2_TETSI|nr:hypothetical protein HHK36_003505 [Tetracentron sinense]
MQSIVTEEDGMESRAHGFLSAAVKIRQFWGRNAEFCQLYKSVTCWIGNHKTSKCVVFEYDPRGITAAHNCTMMAVTLFDRCSPDMYFTLFSFILNFFSFFKWRPL